VDQKDEAGFRGTAPGRGSKGRSLPEAETLLLFEGLMKAGTSPVFNI